MTNPVGRALDVRAWWTRLRVLWALAKMDARVSVLAVRPTDVVVLQLPNKLGFREADVVLAAMRRVLGPTVRVVLLDQGATLKVLRGCELAVARPSAAPPEAAHA